MWESPKVRLMFKAIRGIVTKEYFRESLLRRLNMSRAILRLPQKAMGWYYDLRLGLLREALNM